MENRWDLLIVGAAMLGGASMGILIAILLDVEGLFATHDLVLHAAIGGFVGGLVALCLFWVLGPTRPAD